MTKETSIWNTSVAPEAMMQGTDDEETKTFCDVMMGQWNSILWSICIVFTYNIHEYVNTYIIRVQSVHISR